MEKKLRLKLCTLFIVTFFSLCAKAANYYFSSISGDDTRTSIQAQNPATPWKTIGKLNSFFPNLLPGDSVLFKKGETFDGLIEVTASGVLNLPIVLSSYGSGNKPIINGFATLQNWTSLGNGIWEAGCSQCGTKVNVIQINGAQQPMGRYPNISTPNKGYLTIKSTNGTSQITDDQLPSVPNWTGAEVVIRKERWIIDRDAITSHTGNTINYTASSSYTSKVGYGYFIQNHPATLDQNGEWYYDPAQKKIKIYYNAGNPNTLNVKASAVNLLVYSEASNITFTNLAFTGANVEAFEIYYATNFKIINCDLSFIGYDGIYAEDINQFSLENCSIQDANNDAVFFANNCVNSSIKNNKIRRTAIYLGSGYSGFSSYQGVTVFGDGNVIEGNDIDSTGYSAISFIGNNTQIKNNFINHFAMVKDDGGGIYTSQDEINSTPIVGRKIIENIVINGIGAPEGTNNPSYKAAEGIYLDDKSKNIEVTGNTVAYCGNSGMLLHNAASITAKNNTFFENDRQWYLPHDNLAPNNPFRNLDIKKNILFAKSTSKLIFSIETISDDISQFGTFDSNYYCRPSNQNNIIFTQYYSTAQGTTVSEYHSLQSWQSKFGKDAASQTSPATATDSILFEYNPSAVAKTVVLNGKYVDVKNSQFSGTYSLPAYASVILIKKPSNCNTSSWTGTFNNSWHNPLNWSCGIVPDENTNVTIGTVTPFNCTISYPATCRSLTVSPIAILLANKNLVITH